MTTTEELVCEPGRSHAMDTEPATILASVLKALADPLRLRMLSAIAADPRGESCVCDLTALAEVSQPTVSHHLKVLKDIGVLDAERRGTWVWYRIIPERRDAVTTLLEAFAPIAIAATEAGEVLAEQELADLDTLVTRLADELAEQTPELPRETVVALVRESFASLARSAKITRHLIPLTERFAKQRLADLTRDRGTALPQVLFVCVANAGRSSSPPPLPTIFPKGGSWRAQQDQPLQPRSIHRCAPSSSNLTHLGCPPSPSPSPMMPCALPTWW